MSFVSFVYVSAARRLFSEEELSALLRKSRANNERDGITGLLLYSGGNFMQAIEGEETPIRALLDRIEADKRHLRITRLLEEKTESRRFPEWSMAFRPVDRLPESERASVHAFMRGDGAHAGDDRGIVRKLLERFRDSMRD